MANYSLQICEMVDNPLTPVFGFDYEFYCGDNEIKKKFEQKFINHYFFHEIGCEAYGRWNHQLMTRLNTIMPYYRQLYETELASQDINFLLNKDLTESTTRELSGVENDIGNKRLSSEENHDITSSSSVNGESSTSSHSTGNHKTSQLNDGVSNASLDQGYLTGVSRDDLTNTDNQQTESSSNNHQQSTGRGTQSQEETNRRENTQIETITFKSQGNIGVTSSAELLQKWREVLINIDEMIIKDCRDLFMQVY